MNRQLIAAKLFEAADGLSIMGDRAEVPQFIWDSLKKIFGRDSNGSTVAKLMVKEDADGNPVGSAWKVKAIAIGQHSIEKKLKELGHGEIKIRFSDSAHTFDGNAQLFGIEEAEYTKYVEPPEEIINDIIAAREGKEIEYTKRAPAGGRSKVDVEEIKTHAAVQQFNDKFVAPIEQAGVKINVNYLKSNNEIDVFEDSVKITLPGYDVTIQIELITRGQNTSFVINDWTGPSIETAIKMRSMRPINELETIAEDIKNAKFKGSIYTKDGKNVITLSEDELESYFNENSAITQEEKVKILKARLDKGKKDKKLATMVLDSFESKDSDEFANFIADFENVLNWNYISRYMDLPESYLEGFADHIDWKWISTRGDLSNQFILKFADKLNLEDVMNNQKLSKATIAKLKAGGYLQEDK